VNITCKSFPRDWYQWSKGTSLCMLTMQLSELCHSVRLKSESSVEGGRCQATTILEDSTIQNDARHLWAVILSHGTCRRSFVTLAISQVPISNCNLSQLFLMGPVVQPHHNDSNQEASATDYLVLFRCACSFKFFMVCVLRGKLCCWSLEGPLVTMWNCLDHNRRQTM
jgi:hypothetical protein